MKRPGRTSKNTRRPVSLARDVPIYGQQAYYIVSFRVIHSHYISNSWRHTKQFQSFNGFPNLACRRALKVLVCMIQTSDSTQRPVLLVESENN